MRCNLNIEAIWLTNLVYKFLPMQVTSEVEKSYIIKIIIVKKNYDNTSTIVLVIQKSDLSKSTQVIMFLLTMTTRW